MKVAETPPAACSCCFQAKPQMTHVDFEVAWDGPTVTDGILDEDGQVVHTLTTAIDDMVVCEECLCAAAALVGMVNPTVQAEELEQLRQANQTLVERLRGLEDYNAKLGAAVAARPEPAKRKRQAAGVA